MKRRGPLFVLCSILFLLQRLTAQDAGGFVSYGQGCGGFGWPPSHLEIRHIGTPSLGKTVEVHEFGVPRFPPYRQQCFFLLFVGLSRTSYLGMSLPYTIPAYLMNTPGCLLLCSIDQAYGSIGHGGGIFGIPNSVRVLGLRLYFQIHTTCLVQLIPILQFSLTSNALEMTIGR
jgi:hypothetical protein